MSSLSSMLAMRFAQRAAQAGSPIQEAVGNANTGSLGGIAGSLGGSAAGAAIGTALFPGVGTAIGAGLGSMAGGKAGEAIEQQANVPSGPGTTIASGGAPQVTGFDAKEATIMGAQALQRLAVRGMQTGSQPNGHRKVFGKTP